MKNQVNFDRIHSAKLDLSEEFKAQFPRMTNLLKQASVIDFTINGNQRFRQYIWNKNGSSYGWLCKLEHCIPVGRNIIDEHILFSTNVGGIINYWTDGDKVENTFIDTNEFTFSLTDTFVGGGLKDCFSRSSGNAGDLNVDSCVTFAQEQNGNVTFYNYLTREIFVYLHDDYSPFEVEPFEVAPPVAIYRYKGVKLFVDYVEILADQWSRIVGSN